MEKLIKNMLGQWSLVHETLKKNDGGGVHIPAKIENKAAIDTKHNPILSDMFDRLKTHRENGRFGDAFGVKGEIKDYVMKAPRGSIDLGHLGELRNATPKIDSQQGSKLSKDDMAEAINHHEGDTKSLRTFHAKHGDKGMRALLDTMGANGEPMEYSQLKLHPSVHHDLVGLVNPGKDEFFRQDPEMRRHGVLPQAPWANTELDPELHKKVLDTWNEAKRGDEDDNEHGGSNGEKGMSKHNDAAVERGLDLFKRHYKLT